MTDSSGFSLSFPLGDNLRFFSSPRKLLSVDTDDNRLFRIPLSRFTQVYVTQVNVYSINSCLTIIVFARIIGNIGCLIYDKHTTITELFLLFARLHVSVPYVKTRRVTITPLTPRPYCDGTFFFFHFLSLFSPRIGHAESKEHLFVYTLRFSRTRYIFLCVVSYYWHVPRDVSIFPRCPPRTLPSFLSSPSPFNP